MYLVLIQFKVDFTAVQHLNKLGSEGMYNRRLTITPVPSYGGVYGLADLDDFDVADLYGENYISMIISKGFM